MDGTQIDTTVLSLRGNKEVLHIPQIPSLVLYHQTQFNVITRLFQVFLSNTINSFQHYSFGHIQILSNNIEIDTSILKHHEWPLTANQ